jgi:hypothetical protein
MPVIPAMTLFEHQDWFFLPYGCKGLDKELPSNMPKLCGPSMMMGGNHAGDLITQWSQTGFVVFLNNALIYWSSKKQTLCETSSFGSECVAMKQATTVYIRGLR